MRQHLLNDRWSSLYTMGDDEPSREIAEELGLSIRTIEAHIYKALQLLKLVILEKN